MGKGRFSAASISVVSRKRRPRASATGLSLSSYSGWATSTPAFESSTVYSSSALGWDTASGTATPPALQIPHSVATKSDPGGARKATLAPSRSAAPPSRDEAAFAEASSRPPYESTPSGATTAVRPRCLSARAISGMLDASVMSAPQYWDFAAILPDGLRPRVVEPGTCP